jgi:uncharacterized protein (TIGR04255 family)
MTTSARTLPDYKTPPVVETVLGVQFEEISKFSIPFFGLYWNRVRSEYPRFQVLPPLGTIAEPYNPAAGQISVSFSVVSEPVVRCWFLDDKGNWLIQLQNDRFILNWRKVTGEEEYPRYEKVRARFELEWTRFCKFLLDERLGSPKVTKCEVTYVNHLEYNLGWKSYGELNQAIALWSGSHSGGFLPSPHRVSINSTYLMSENNGKLHIAMQPVLRKRDGEEILQLNFTAQCDPPSPANEEILQCFNLSRKWIVEGFTDFTAPHMHKIWERIQ